MDTSKYEKQLSNGDWEVKLGAGIVSEILTQSDFVFLKMIFESSGTCTVPPRFGSLDKFIKMTNCYVAVVKYLKAKEQK